MSDILPDLKSDFADGHRWLVRPLDYKAAAIVARLGRVMQLGPGDDGREVRVSVSSVPDGHRGPIVSADGTVECYLSDPTDQDMMANQMRRIALAIAFGALADAGLLLHAALAEYRGSGFVLAGPSGIGKSTASRRLPIPWRSLSDDSTLVVRDREGRFWAHPWPTWSLFFDNGPGGSWPVERAVPLRAVFFIDQARVELLRPLNTTQATGLTMATATNVGLQASMATERSVAHSVTADGLRAVRALTAAVPAYRLGLSLDGSFWRLIEPVLPVAPDRHQT